MSFDPTKDKLKWDKVKRKVVLDERREDNKEIVYPCKFCLGFLWFSNLEHLKDHIKRDHKINAKMKDLKPKEVIKEKHWRFKNE